MRELLGGGRAFNVGYVPQRLPLSVKEFFQLVNASKGETIEILKSIGLGRKFWGERLGIYLLASFKEF
jgi:hypothetical protein